MSFAAEILESQLDTFTLTVLKKRSKELTDIVTPKHPIIKKLEAAGGVEKEDAGRGPVADVIYANPDRTTMLSRSRDYQLLNEAPVEGITEAQYEWGMIVNTLVIGMYEYENSKDSPDRLGKLIDKKFKQVEVGLNNKIVDIIWDGLTIGTNKIFGINDMVRADPTADPARGKVGGIGVADLPTWTNNAVNYNKAFRTVAGGIVEDSMIDDSDNDQGDNNDQSNQSLLDLYTACCNNVLGADGCPNLMPCNLPFFKMIHALYRDGLIFRDDAGAAELAQDAFKFHNASVYQDNDCPDDPNDAVNGVCLMLNTNAMKLVYANGIVRTWGHMRRLTTTGFGWDQKTQLTLTNNDLRKQGIFIGALPA